MTPECSLVCAMPRRQLKRLRLERATARVTTAVGKDSYIFRTSSSRIRRGIHRAIEGRISTGIVGLPEPIRQNRS